MKNAEETRMSQKCIGIDIGGTTVKIGIFTTEGTLLEKWEVPTRKEENGKYILSDIEICGLNEFQDSSIVILCKIKTTPQEQWKIKRVFNQMMKERFEQEGIEIPFPQVVVNKADDGQSL